jgi:hypothetical protein
MDATQQASITKQGAREALAAMQAVGVASTLAHGRMDLALCDGLSTGRTSWQAVRPVGTHPLQHLGDLAMMPIVYDLCELGDLPVTLCPPADVPALVGVVPPVRAFDPAYLADEAA